MCCKFMSFLADAVYILEETLDFLLLDGVAPMITYPTPANSAIMHSRLVCQDRNLCFWEPAYWPGPTKPQQLLNQWCNLKILQDV